MNALTKLVGGRLGVPALVLLMLAGSPALAHPRVNEGLARLDEADFRAALAAFERAEAADDLTRADLAALLEGRAMAAQALGDEAGVTQAANRLAALDPEHHFRAAAPPEIRTAFERAVLARSGPLTLELRSTREPDAVGIEAIVQGDPGGLVRGVRLSARVAGGEWQETNGVRTRVPVAADQTVEAFATARGPGGAPIASAGQADAPLRFAPTVLDDGGGRARAGDEDDDRRRRGGGGAWVWIGAGAALVAAAVVLSVVAVSSSGDSDLTRPHAPEVAQ